MPLPPLRCSPSKHGVCGVEPFFGVPVPIIGPVTTAFAGTCLGAGFVTWMETMSLERSTRVGLGVSRLIDRMEKKGWVTRERGSKDRRRVWCMITSDGLSLLDRLDAPIDTVNDLMSAALNDEELRTLTAYLDRIRARLGALDQV